MYIDIIEKYRRTYKQSLVIFFSLIFIILLFSFAHEQVVDEYESIDKRVGVLLRYSINLLKIRLMSSFFFSIRSNDITTDRINDFLFEIEHLEGRLDNLNKFLDLNQLKVFHYLFDLFLNIFLT